MAEVKLRRGEEKDILGGRLWVYDNEIEKISGPFEPGDVANIHAFSGAFLGRGFVNPASRMTVRLLTRRREECGETFFRRRIEEAVELRRKLGKTDACRLVFGEADGLPALIVDRFGGCLVMQTLALGMERRKDMVVSILRELLAPRCIFERNDVPLREKEGLRQQKGVLWGEEPGLVEIRENGLRMLVDVANGQKTGYFLDQSENRAAIAPYVTGGEVLDCFCHTGGFALHAAKYGASRVEAVDISAPALEMVKKNAALNGFSNIATTEANVFDLLKKYEEEGRRFDAVVLDPPAFAKNRAALTGAWRGYKEINLRGMKLVRPGGFLVTCSCSHFMTPGLFIKMLAEAAGDVGIRAKVVEQRYQGRDHPFTLTDDESLYLKCVVLQIL